MQPENPASRIQRFGGFARGSLPLILRGNRAYAVWLALLGALIVSGVLAYANQVRTGLIVTAMRDPVSWGFYIGNFTFLVGVAAAAVIVPDVRDGRYRPPRPFLPPHPPHGLSELPEFRNGVGRAAVQP